MLKRVSHTTNVGDFFFVFEFGGLLLRIGLDRTELSFFLRNLLTYFNTTNNKCTKNAGFVLKSYDSPINNFNGKPYFNFVCYGKIPKLCIA